MKIHDCIQGTPEWYWLRAGMPTASRFDSIITPAKGELSKGITGYIAELIAETVTGIPADIDSYMSRAMVDGVNTEAEARNWYAFDTGRDVEQVGFITDDDGHFGCSPDGLVDEDGGLELKCPTAKVHVGYLLDNASLVTAYKCQVHGCLAVTGRAWWDVMSYCQGFPPVLIRVEPDEFTGKLSVALSKFRMEFEQAVAAFEDATGEKLTKPKPPKTKTVPEPTFM